MSQEHQPGSIPLFTQFEVAAGAETRSPAANLEDKQVLLRLLAAQERQTKLLEELVTLVGNQQRQRANELNQWKKAHPELAQECRQAAETLGKVQAEYLGRVTEEIQDNGETMMDGEFMLNEFIDRFGPRMAHLHSVLQVLSHLGAPLPAEENAGS